MHRLGPKNLYVLAPLMILLSQLSASLWAESERHPNAPEQLAEFEFLLGKHNCEDVLTDLDGSSRKLASTWVGRYVLDGHGIQDSYTNGEFSATNIRTFDAEKNQWRVIYVREPGGITGTWEGHAVSERNIVLERIFDWQGEGAISRLVFEQRGPERFEWRSEYESGSNIYVDWTSSCTRAG